MSTPAYTITRESITVVMEGKTYTIRGGEKFFEAARRALFDEDWKSLPGLLEPGSAVQKWTGDAFTFQGGKLYYQGDEVPSMLNDRIIAMADGGADPSFLFRFWERLQRNPSFRSVNQLYGFLQHSGIPINGDGTFMAYKKVRADYLDVHTGTIDNHPGAHPEMPRNKISDDPELACHDGFHVGALAYASTFGPSDGHIIICKVDPEHVVCVPHDASQMKVRVCQYEVVGICGSKLPDTVMDPEDIPEEMVIEEVEGRPWSYLDNVPDEDLVDEPTELLRKYAANDLKIVGASKIPGGKEALIGRIVDARRKSV